MGIDVLQMRQSLDEATAIFYKMPSCKLPDDPIERTEVICKIAARIYRLKIEGK